MNKFFDFKAYNERLNNRQYFTHTWDKLQMESFRLLPFQYKKSGNDFFQMYHLGDSSTDITDYFFGSTNLLTGWTSSGTGTFSASGANITEFDMSDGAYCYSNDISLTDGDILYFKIDATFSDSTDWTYHIYSAVSGESVYSVTGQDKELTYTVDATADYHVRIYKPAGTHSFTSATCEAKDSLISIYEGDDIYVSYLGDTLYEMIPTGDCYFMINDGNGLYSDDCLVGYVNEWVRNWTNGVSLSLSAESLTNPFNVVKGETIYFYGYHSSGIAASDLTAELVEGATETAFSESTFGDLILLSVTATTNGTARIKLTSNKFPGSLDLTYWDVFKSYSNRHLKIKVGSDFDFADIHYADGFEQWLYKKGNVERSKSPQKTVVGEEKNGRVIAEKIITANQYKVVLKVTESEYEALLSACAAMTSNGYGVTIIDQMGNEFECYDLEMSEPDWYDTNGKIELTFKDNINVSRFTNSEL